MIEQFHFLRPLWLLSIFPAAFFVWLLFKQNAKAANWHGAINDKLLKYLTDSDQSSLSRLPWLALLLGWIIAAIALAGPTWNKLPQPVHQRQDALVIVLDLSYSMLAEDIKPSRLVRARHKILDILQQRSEGVTALIAYAGDTHIVTPLTDDYPTITNLVPSLSPLIMPIPGSDPVTALREARTLFKNAGIDKGKVLLLTDGITDQNADELDDSLANSGIELSILGIGTSDGAPIPADQGFLKDNQGNIIIPKLDRRPMETLAKANSGRYIDITFDEKDIEFLMPAVSTSLTEDTILTEREFDLWHDRGPLLVLLLLPLALMGFRRGWLLMLPLLMVLPADNTYAFEWRDLWQRKDQQGMASLSQGYPELAAEEFTHPEWKGIANYHAGNYEQAVENFSSEDSARNYYNRGNALAWAGKLDDAIAAYDQALAIEPDMEDALFNKALVEKIRDEEDEQNQQMENQQNSQQQQTNDQNQSQQNSSQQSEQENQEQSGQQNQQQPDQQNQGQSQSTERQSQENEADQEDQAGASQMVEQKTREQDNEGEESDGEQLAENNQQSFSEQQQQAMEQWLRQIPDDPSGLLRRKFLYESRLRQQMGEINREQPLW